MLPNHSPLVIAEQFGTLESLYPGGSISGSGGRPAPTSAPPARCAATRSSADRFPHDVQELQVFFGPAQDGEPVRAVPGTGLEVPLWILGSSTFGPRLAADAGSAVRLRLALRARLPAQRPRPLPARVQAFDELDEPHVMAGVNVFAAETDDEARRLFTTPQHS